MAVDPDEAAHGVVYRELSYSQAEPFYIDMPGATSPSSHAGPRTSIYVYNFDRGTYPGDRYQTVVSTQSRASGYGTQLVYKANGYADVHICVPSETPGPDAPDPPAPDRPPGAPDAPAPIECDEGDICAILRELLQDVQILSAELLSLRELVEDNFAAVNVALDEVHDDTTALRALVDDDVTAIVGCPAVEVTGKLPAVLGDLFTTARPRCAIGATAGATVEVTAPTQLTLPSNCVGVAVFVHDIPAYIGQREGDPPYEVFGHVAFGGAAGYERPLLIWYEHSLWLPIAFAHTKLSIRLAPPMTATVQFYEETLP